MPTSSDARGVAEQTVNYFGPILKGALILSLFCLDNGVHLKPFRLHINGQMRIFNVCLYDDIAHTSWPMEFGRTSGFSFFGDNSVEPLEPQDREFKTRIAKLARAIWQTLMSFYKVIKTSQSTQLTVKVANTDPPLPETFDVFLAEVADSLRDIHRRVVSDLERQGVKVVIFRQARANLYIPWPKVILIKGTL